MRHQVAATRSGQPAAQNSILSHMVPDSGPIRGFAPLALSAAFIAAADSVAGSERLARVSVAAPALPVSGAASAPSPKPAKGASIPLLKDRLNSAFASAEARREFVDSCLSMSDSALSDAWAVKRLSERYASSGSPPRMRI